MQSVSEREGLAAIDEARSKVLVDKGLLDPTIAIDSLAMLEECSRHFYLKARCLEILGDMVNWEILDRAWAQAGKWAERVAGFRHPRIAAVNLAGDPNDKVLGEQTTDQLREGIMADLEKLSGAAIIDLKALLARSANVAAAGKIRIRTFLASCVWKRTDAGCKHGVVRCEVPPWNTFELHRPWRYSD